MAKTHQTPDQIASLVEQRLQSGIQRFREVIIMRLQHIGEEAVNAARTQGKYKDQTANLRSSTGYVIVENGQIISQSNFPAITSTATGGTGTKGSTNGREFALSIARMYPQGIALIVVAGMSYAVYVQGKGLDVLSSAELEAERLKNIMIKELSKMTV
ncbi:MAG: hypothetical protein LBG17_04700 [Bacteroidales bacterium]|jgi:pyrimidine deaminase RibD-like protein|nr:hypothetical protein [Bacteroidales bacterium]